MSALHFKRETIVGIIGGGQLGRMMILEGRKLGLKFVVLDPCPHCPSASIADRLIVGSFYDMSKLRELADASQIITYEFEHIGAEALLQLAEEGHKIYPSPLTLQMIQDKYLQKTFLKENSIPTPDFLAVSSLEELYRAGISFGFPMLLKQRKGGYDGKGNHLIEREEDIPEAFNAMKGEANQLMVEAFVNYRLEISAIVAGGRTGEIKIYPLSENLHENNILKRTIVPARISDVIAEKARGIAMDIVKLLEGIGIFCIEMFVDSDNNILVNEIAPRTHNSGHYSLEGCYTSQFFQHLRCILNLPLGSTALIHPCVMLNLLGEEGYSGEGRLDGLEAALGIPKVYVHYYDKKETKPHRKMGHITIVDEVLEQALIKAEEAASLVKAIGARRDKDA